MQRTFKRDLLVALIQAKRPDLANILAHTVIAMDVQSLIGETLWGLDAKAHFFNNSIVLEEIPKGKRRGITTSKMTLYVPQNLRSISGELHDQIVAFAKAVKTNPWKRLSGMLIVIHNADKKAGGRTQLNLTRQKGVHAPDPEQGKLPKPANNRHKVWIDMTGDSVTVRDDTDQNNLPTAFTQGPRAYQAALKIRSQWQDLPFSQILKVWDKAKIKYHHYMAMD